MIQRVFLKLLKMSLKFKSLILILGIIGVLVFWRSILSDNPLKQTNGATDILLLGVTGGQHDGADLTDTMILAAFDQKAGKTNLLSLPRDLWSETLRAKINTAYHYGEERKPGDGFILSKEVVEEVTDLPVHYVAKIDLQGLEKIIDFLGGVEINIKTAFDDDQYPISGKENDPCGGDPEYKCRYQHLHFSKGLQTLNGEQAIEYIRSRHAEGDEGTDFARNQRQQVLIMALKKKVISVSFLFHPERVYSFIQLVDKAVDTDFSKEELPYALKTLALAGFGKIKTVLIEQFLVNPPLSPSYQGQWVLLPKTGDFSQIHQYLKEQLLNR